MKKRILSLLSGLLLLAGLLIMVSPALADWVPGDPTKWVQPPNLNGFNVNATNPYFLADDFLCTRTGPITDVHIWGSYVGNVPDPNLTVSVSLWSDYRPEVGYSRPNAFLWGMDFAPGSYSVVESGTSNERFINPGFPSTDQGPDSKIFLYNFFIDPSQAFIQESGNTYWLAVIAYGDPENPASPFGWKTSMYHWGDNAVWTDAEEWNELRDPEGNSLDMAFAITTMPLPGSLLLLGTGLLGVLGLGWRRRA